MMARYYSCRDVPGHRDEDRDIITSKLAKDLMKYVKNFSIMML